MIPLRLLATTLAFGLMAASCSDDADSGALLGTTTTDAPTTTTLESGVADTSTSTTTVTTTTTVAEPDVDETAIVKHWNDTWDLAADPTAGPIDGASEAATSTLVELFRTGTAPPARTLDHSPRLEIGNDGTVTITDCLLSTPPISDANSSGFRGTVTTDGDGYRVDAVEVVSLGGCVPRELAEAAIAGYEAHWDAAADYWVPADPASPLVAMTLTGDLLEVTASLLAEHAEKGYELRGRPTTRPEVIEYNSRNEVVLLDCQIVDPGRGLFETATGVRLADIAPISDGQLDIRSSTVRLENGAWKVADRAGQADVDCDAAPTARGIPIT